MTYSKIFKNWRNDFLIEARIDKIKSRYPNNDKVIDKLSKGDPSNNDAYLGWMAKEAITNSQTPEDVIDVVKGFHDNKQRLKVKDLYQWKFEDLKNALQQLGQSKTQQKLDIKDQAIKIYEDDDYLFIAPLSTGASCLYGANTKWCIAASKDNQFKNYAMQNEINFVFLFLKKAEEDSPYSKIALCYYPEDKMKQIAEKIYNDTTSGNYFRRSEKPTIYGGMGKESIYNLILKNPQEIYNAKDDLSCNMIIPPSIDGRDMGVHLQNTSRFGECGQFLDDLLKGQWKSKFQDLIYDNLNKIRGGINQEVEKENKELRKLVEEIAQFSETEKITTLKYFKGHFNPYGEYIDIFYSDMLRSGGFDDEEQIYFRDGSLVLNIDYSKLGLKPVEYSDREKLYLYAFFNKMQSWDAYDFVEKMIDGISKSTPEEQQALWSTFQLKIDDNFSSLMYYRNQQSLINSLKQTDMFARAGNISISPRRDQHGMLDNSGFNIIIKLISEKPDQYIQDYKYAKEFEANIQPILSALKNELLTFSKEMSKIKEFLPKREYFFWEPV